MSKQKSPSRSFHTIIDRTNYYFTQSTVGPARAARSAGLAYWKKKGSPDRRFKVTVYVIYGTGEKRKTHRYKYVRTLLDEPVSAAWRFKKLSKSKRPDPDDPKMWIFHKVDVTAMSPVENFDYSVVDSHIRKRSKQQKKKKKNKTKKTKKKSKKKKKKSSKMKNRKYNLLASS